MVEFRELPIDILPLILNYVVKSGHLAASAEVDSTWNAFATPRLYERVSIYSWHRDAKGKVLQLFHTLATYPHLAKHVRRLEIRDFPKAVLNSEGNVPTLVIKGLMNCQNLRSCTWTRDGSLSSEILGALSCISELRELEFNGHSQGQYDPRMLCQFRSLSKVSVIMPSSIVVSQLRSMFVVSGHNLRHFTVICKTSPVLTDTLLENMAPSLTSLEELYLTGCPKVTEKGVLAVIAASQPGLRALGLESVSSKFDMAAFAHRCTSTQALASLRSITLTISQSALVQPDIWRASVLHLLSNSPLERFQLYAASSTNLAERDPGSIITTAISSFWLALVAAHGERLRRLSVLRMPISLACVYDVCSRCPNLEELFMVADPRTLDALPDSFCAAKNLRAIHINYPIRAQSSEDAGGDDGSEGEAHERDDSHPVLSPEEALAFVKRCGLALTQFGCNSKVWRVGRKTRIEEDSSVSSGVTLLPYEGPDIPEQFLVVRTS